MTPQPDACEIVLTAPDPGWLAQFTNAILAERLCAAVHILPAITSTYWWHGELTQRQEWRASLHTRRSLADVVIARIQRDHPYEVPGVVVLPILSGNPAYLAWITTETQPVS